VLCKTSENRVCVVHKNDTPPSTQLRKTNFHFNALRRTRHGTSHFLSIPMEFTAEAPAPTLGAPVKPVSSWLQEESSEDEAPPATVEAEDSEEESVSYSVDQLILCKLMFVNLGI
jgi:hypothetical protein